MLHLTKQERAVLFVLALVLFIGSSVHFIFKKYPQLQDIVNFVDSDHIYQKVDLNTASLEELVSIPYIGEYTAGNIIEYRKKKGPFSSIAQVKLVRGIKEKNYQIFSKYLKVSQ